MNAAARAINQSSIFEGSLAEIRLSKEWLLIAALLAAILCSALSVIYSTNHYRAALNQLEMVKQQNQRLHMQQGKLLLEQASLSTASRVEKMAESSLGMRLPTLKKHIS